MHNDGISSTFKYTIGPDGGTVADGPMARDAIAQLLV